MKRQKKNIEQAKKTVKKQKVITKAPVTSNNNFLSFIEKNSVLILTGLIVLIGFAAFGSYLTGDKLFFFLDIGSDTINQNYPAIIHKINMADESLISTWSFYKGMGDVYYTPLPTEPYGLFMVFLQQIGISFFGADYFVYGRFIIIFIFHFLLTGLLFYAYLRTISINKFSSLIGALLIAFSGYMVVGSGWGFSGQIFKAVFLLFSFAQFYIKKRWYFFPFAVLYLSSNPFVLFIYSLFLLLYIIFRTSYKRESLKSFFLLLGKLVALGIAGILMNAVNIISTLQKMLLSPRVGGNASYSQILSSGENIDTFANHDSSLILRFFSNDIIGVGSEYAGWFNYLESPLFYIGIICLLLLPQVFIFLNKRNKIIFGSFLGFWILTLLFPYLRHAFLAFTGDYYRYGFDFFIPFVLLFYAIFALNKIIEKRKVNIVILSVTAAVLLVVLFIPYEVSNSINNTIRYTVVFLIIVYSALLFLFTKKEYSIAAQILILALVIFELGFSSYQSYKDRVAVESSDFELSKGGYDDGTQEAVSYIKSIEKSKFYRIEKDYQSGGAQHGSLNDALAQSYFGTSSYSSFSNLNYIRFFEETRMIPKGDETATRWVNGMRGSPLLQTFANVKYHLSKDAVPGFLRFKFNLINEVKGVKILKNEYYLPFGYSYDKFITPEDMRSLIKYRLNEGIIENISKEMQMKGRAADVEKVVPNLVSFNNMSFNSEEEFLYEMSKSIDKKILEENKKIILRHSLESFYEQLALLNAFVSEDESLNSGLEKLSPNDTSVFVDINKFNFDIYKQYTDKLKADTFKIKSFTNKKITGEIELNKPKMLFFTIPFDKGWHAEVNGKEEQLHRINYGFTGLKLAEGKYEIKLYYIPANAKLGVMISIISVILFWFYLGYDIFRKRKLKDIIN